MATATVETNAVLITPQVERIRILHVDDDQALLEVSKQILCMENNFEIENASSVDEAHKKIKTEKFDVIICDYEMPKKDGLQFLKELKEQGNQTPFILFTGKGREEVAIKALNLGADRYFNKQGSPETVYGELAYGIRAVHSHKQTEKKYTNEQMLRTILLDNVPCTALILEKNTRKIIASNKIAKEQGAVPGRKCYEACAGGTTPCTFCLAPKVWETNQPQSIEVEANGKHYRGVWVPYNEDLYVHYIFDITKQKKTELDLQQKYEVLERLGDSIGAGLAIIGKDYRVVWANSTLKNIGVSLSKKCYESLNLKDICPDCGVKKVFEENVPLDIHEFKRVHDDGTKSWVELRVTPLKDKNGVVTAALELAVPITERKQKEKELKNSKNFIEKVLYSTPNLIYIYNLKEHRNSYSNKEVADFLGYNPKQITDMGDKLFANILHLEDREKVAAHHARFASALDNEIYEIEYRMKHADGKWRWLRSRDVVFSREEDGTTKEILGCCEDITERKKTKDILRANEQRLRTFLENSPLAIFVTDPTGKYLYVNEAGCKLVKYTKEELRTKSIPDLVYNYDTKDGMKSFETAKKTGKSSRETCLKRKDGIPISVHINAAKLPDGNLIGFCEDLTEFKEAQEALLESQNKFKDLVETTDDFVWEINAQGQYTYCSPQMKKLWGYDPKEAIGKSPFEVMLKVEKIEAFDFFKDISSSQQGFAGLITSAYNADGKLIYAETNSVPIFDHNGNFLGYRGISRDITKRQMMEEELRANEEKFRTLFEGMVQGAFWQKADGTLMDINKSALEMFGLTKTDFVSRTSFSPQWKVITEEGCLLPAEKHPSMVALQTGKTVNQVVGVFNPKKNDYVWMNVNAVPQFKDNNQKPFQVFVTLHDISDLRNAQEKINTISEKLRVVGSLTRHDISNKLAIINADTYLLKKRVDNDPEKLKYLTSIESAVSQSTRLFEFGRQYENIGIEKPENIIIEHFFNQAATLHTQRKDIKFKNQTKGLVVTADSLLRLVFYNFIDDSLKHGKKVTEIKLHYQNEKDATKLIYEDNGVGIPKESKSKLFIEGFSTGGGTGLGLALSKRILQVYGWEITEKGIPGKGAKFIITIPKSTKTKKMLPKRGQPNAQKNRKQSNNRPNQ